MKKEKNILIVLGMHRSGTSVTTRMFNFLGADPGNNLMLPAEDNPNGFWEPADIVAIHDELLQHLGYSWDDPRPLPDKWWDRPDLKEFEVRLGQLAEQYYSDIKLPIIKDPRLCRLLPIWHKIFKKLGWKQNYILVGRSPLEIAGSLAKRNQLTESHSYLLWLRHVMESEKWSRGSPRTFLLYDQLFGNWEAETKRCVRELGLQNLHFSESIKSKIENLIDPNLNHNGSIDDAIDTIPELSLFATDAYHGFRQATSGRLVGGELQTQFDLISQRLLVADKLYSSIWIAAIKQRDSAYEVIGNRDGQICEFTQNLFERDGEITSLKQVLSDRDSEISVLRQEITDLDEQVRELKQALLERDDEFTELKKTLSEGVGQISALSNAVTNREAQICVLKQTLSERDGELTALEQTLSDSDGHVSELSKAVTERDEKICEFKKILSDRDGEFSELQQGLIDSEGYIAVLKQKATDHDEQIVLLTNETVRRGEWALNLDQQLKEAQVKITETTSSHSWKITLPLRETRRWVNNPVLQAKRYMKILAKLGRVVYIYLPLSYQTKTTHRLFLAKYARWLLRASNGLPVYAQASEAIVDTAKPMIAHDSTVSSINLTTSFEPVVSVIIPIYGKCEYTLQCLISIALNPPSTPFEIIIIDDCSPDNSAEVLQGIDGICLITNTENQGFIRSCNIGAKVASGQYLYFLNNDTEVTSGWLDELIRTFHEFPGTGLAGSKLVYPDGTLQEAGGIIWQDGSAWNFGRNQDPLLPIYNYAREVDYCSGASIMVPKELFEELRGFDEYYLPAYCEDSDLALKIRDKGYRVIYQPLSTVVHYEGITCGSDTSQGTKAYQIENSKKLFERWRHRLQQHQVNGVDVDSAKDRCAKRRVLVLDHCTPTPNQDAGSVTILNLILLLREMQYQVTFIPEDNFLYMPEYTTSLQRLGVEVLYAPYVTSVEQHLKEYGVRYDLAFLFRPGVSERYGKMIRKHCKQAKILYHTVDLHFLRMTREADLYADVAKKKLADEMKQRELAAIRAADVSIVHSTTELDLLRLELPNEKIHVFPLIMNVCSSVEVYEERHDIVFIGGYQHTPNVDAVMYFVSDVMPILRERLKGVRFYAVGSKPPVEIQALARDDVIITGFIEKLSPLLDHIRVSVAPLRYGAGIKGKIGTAMTSGIPVVATTLGAEGMSLTDGENILIANDADAFAEAVVRLYNDESLWNNMSKAGLDFSEQAWGAAAAWNTLDSILSDIKLFNVRGNHALTLYSE